MSEGAQRHGFGLYPGVPSIDLATLTKEEPVCTLIVEKLGVAGALLDFEDDIPRDGSCGSRPSTGPALAGRVDTSTVPTYSTEPVVSGTFRTVCGVAGNWPRCENAGSDSSSSIADMTILAFFISILRRCLGIVLH
jgi:hypothetical protein